MVIEYTLGVEVGERVRATRDLEVRGAVLCRRGALGTVMAVFSDAGRLVVCFDKQTAGEKPLRVTHKDVAAVAQRWRKGTKVEALRDLYTLGGVCLAKRGDVGLVCGLAPRDTSKLLVRFESAEGSETVIREVRVAPQEDIEPAWRSQTKLNLTARELRRRTLLVEQEAAAWAALVRIYDDEDLSSPMPYDKHVTVLMRNLRDETVAPQSVTDWVPPPQVSHHRALKFVAQHRGDPAADALFSKSFSRLAAHLVATEGQQEYEYFHALCLYEGFFMKQDVPVCIKGLRRLVGLGHAKATNLLGVALLEGRGEQRPDAFTAMTLFARAENLQSAAASFNMGVVFERQSKPLLARHRYENGAVKGHVPAQYAISQAYLQAAAENPGLSFERDLGIDWLRKAAGARHEGARYELIKQIPHDAETAIELLLPAAQAGHIESMLELGLLLMTHDEKQPSWNMEWSRATPEEVSMRDVGRERRSPWPHWQGALPERMRTAGKGSSANRAKGVQWLKKAAATGFAEAENAYALLMMHGEGMRQDTAEGIALLRQAAAQECGNAMHNLACCLFNGDGVEQDTFKAVDLWRHSASSTPESHRKLMDLANWVFRGESHMQELAAELKSQAICELLLRVNAEKEFLDAPKAAPAPQTADAAVPKEAKKEKPPLPDEPDAGVPALRLPSMATRRRRRSTRPQGLSPPSSPPQSPKSPKSPAQREAWAGSATLGVEYTVPQPFADGVAHDVAGGVVGQMLESQYSLGLQYLFGTGVPENHQAAAQLFWRVADSTVVPHPGAQNIMGVCFQHGLGVPKHVKMAVHWFRKAANERLPLAMHNLACCLFTGEGVMENRKEAVRWWRRAAEMGYGQASFRLGLCQLAGEGVASDVTLGFWNLQQAASTGMPQAQELLEQLSGQRSAAPPLALVADSICDGIAEADNGTFFNASLARSYKFHGSVTLGSFCQPPATGTRSSFAPTGTLTSFGSPTQGKADDWGIASAGSPMSLGSLGRPSPRR